MMRLLSSAVRCVRCVDGVILAQRMPLPVFPQQNPAMVGMSLEAHAEHVPALALHPVGATPDASQRGAAVRPRGQPGAQQEGDVRVEVLDAAENLHPLLFPVDRSEEAEVTAAEAGTREARHGLPLLRRDGDRDQSGLDGRLDGELLAKTRGGVGGGQRRHFVSAAAGRRSPVFWKCATCSCSFSSPYISESGVGGQPGTYTSTGTTRSTPFTT